MKSEYLIFNIVVLLGPIIALRCIPYIRKPRPVPTFVALVFSAVVFVVWDIIVTGFFWYFNPTFTLGPRIAGVPFEEILFFLTVPFGCLVLWVNWDKVYPGTEDQSSVPLMFICISTALAVIGLWMRWYYTVAICVVYALILSLDHVMNTHILRKVRFLSFTLVIVLLTFVCNLYLTARPIVLYNSVMKTNLNILTIPVEDFVYGLALISFVIVMYEYCVRKIGAR